MESKTRERNFCSASHSDATVSFSFVMLNANLRRHVQEVLEEWRHDTHYEAKCKQAKSAIRACI